MQQQYDLALYPYVVATYYEKTNPVPYFYISECFLKMGNKKAALRTYDEMLAILDKSPFFPHLRERIRMSAEGLRKELGATAAPAPAAEKKS
jgi:hypothetical protein